VRLPLSRNCGLFSLSLHGEQTTTLTGEREISYWPGNAVLFTRSIIVVRRRVIDAVVGGVVRARREGTQRVIQ